MLVGVLICFVVVDILTLPGLAVKHSQTSFKQAGVRLELFFPCVLRFIAHVWIYVAIGHNGNFYVGVKQNS